MQQTRDAKLNTLSGKTIARDKLNLKGKVWKMYVRLSGLPGELYTTIIDYICSSNFASKLRTDYLN